MSGLGGRVAIAGVGATDFSKDSGRSELRLAVEAVRAAVADAGLDPADVDGMVTYDMDSNPEIEVARNLGVGELTFFSRIPHGGGAACALVHQAAMAIATGAATTVVVYRAFNERSGRRFGVGHDPGIEPTASAVAHSWYAPFGLMTPASWVAMFARRYMHTYGVTSADFGRVAVIDRQHAATNPAAWFYERPITLEEHQASRWIVDPLHLLDCCQESDGAVALVLTSAERASSLAQPSVLVSAVAQGSGREQESMTSYSRNDDDMTTLPEMALVGRQLRDQSGVAAGDVQVAILYDHFTPFVLVQLEALGFCGRGEAKDLLRDGGVGTVGERPGVVLNPHGGQLGEAYIHGMNGIAEGVRQIRRQAVNQVDDVEHVLVSAGTGVPTSALVLGRGN